MIPRVSFRTAVALGALAVGLAPLAARAEAPALAAMASVPCASAAAAMRASSTMPRPHVDPSDVDATYKAMMAEHAHAMMELGSLERRCGNDAKVKADVGTGERAARMVLNTLQVF